MPGMPSHAFAQIQPQDYVSPTSTAMTTQYQAMCGQRATFGDVDVSAGVVTTNTPTLREAVLVKNGSGVAITPGSALNWVSGYWGTQVQACPNGSAIRCYAPAYVRGSSSNTIPDGAFFWAIFRGQTSVLTDGTSIAVNDSLVVGAASGKVATDYGSGGGALYTQTAASAAVTATTVATKFDKSYTFPANSLSAGDVIRLFAEVIATATNSTDTLTLDLMLGSSVIATTGAIDVANNDSFTFAADISIRTAGASGTLVGATIVNTATGNVTFKSVPFASATIDTTATQQLAIRATWSSNNAGNSCRQDNMTVSRLNPNIAGLRSGTNIAAVTGTGSSVLTRAAVNCTW